MLYMFYVVGPFWGATYTYAGFKMKAVVVVLPLRPFGRKEVKMLAVFWCQTVSVETQYVEYVGLFSPPYHRFIQCL